MIETMKDQKMIDPVKAGIKNYWDSSYKDYDYVDEFNSRRKNLLDKLKAICGDERKKVLDVGTGTGHIALIMAELGHDVTGIDLSKNMMSVAKEKSKNRNLSIKLMEGDVEKLPFDDTCYDIVINRHVLWTLQNPEKAVREWVRVVRPGGMIVLIDSVWSPKCLRNSLFKVYSYIKDVLLGKHNSDYPKHIKEKLPHYDGKSPSHVDGQVFTNGLDGKTIASFFDGLDVECVTVAELGYQFSEDNRPWLRRRLSKGPYMFLVYGIKKS